MLSRTYLLSLRAESDEKLANLETDIRFDREPGSSLTDFDYDRLDAIYDEMARRNALNPLNPPFPGLR